MKKMAVFVEGQTEQIFLRSLLLEIAGEREMQVECDRVGPKAVETLFLTKHRVIFPDKKYFVLVMNCEHDGRVKSVILERREKLAQKGYSLILGVRDLYPEPLSRLAEVTAKLTYKVPTTGVPTFILLAVSEIEAWFLQEHTHYARIDENLDVANFKTLFNFDPIAERADTIEQPSKLLHRIYQSVGKAYKKTRKHVERTVEAIDYGEMYFNIPQKLPHVKSLLQHVNGFLN